MDDKASHRIRTNGIKRRQVESTVRSAATHTRVRQSYLDDSSTSRIGGWTVADRFDAQADVILKTGDAEEFLPTLPSESVSLIISSPPYNVGKEYETTVELDRYLETQGPVLRELVRVLEAKGSLCWQVGNYVDGPESFPLDIFYYPMFKKLGLKLRNRIVWTFGHGMHMSRRLSPRYETLLWFTKGDAYTFNLDEIRVPSKYPGKRHFKGPRAGQPSGNPLGKNPSDVWSVVMQDWEEGVWEIPNVKAAHPEKTIHPCQFPVELVERCVLAFTKERDWVLDPYAGVGSAAVAALLHNRRALMVERDARYAAETRRRLERLASGTLPIRPIGKPIMVPSGREKWARVPDEWRKGEVHSIY
jgi:adenine-specific DNA-methyltransferase